MPTRLGRILRAADFERLLNTPSRARSPLFAVHHLASEPSQPPKPKRLTTDLSTGGDQLTHRLVEDSPAPEPAVVQGHWLGFVVPKRLAKRAVTRNLIRRIARASLEAQLRAGVSLPAGLWTLRLRAPIDRKAFPSAKSDALRAALHEDLALLWRRALNPRAPAPQQAMMGKLLRALVRGYQLFFSHWLNAGCRYQPSCSNYALQALDRHGAAAGSYLAARRLLRCHPFCLGGHDPVPEQPPSLRFPHPHLSMTDIRRTVLWVVFSMSLLLLWDAWQKHQGRPSLFSPAAPRPAASAAPLPASGVPNAGSAPAQAGTPPTAPLTAAPSGETYVVRTDLVKASFSSIGGQLVQLELLKHKDDTPAAGPMKVLEQARGYAAQSGLVGVAGAPTHLTPMQLTTAERELKDGAQQLNLRFEAPEVGGVKLVKTYTFERGSYAIKVRHEVVNGSAAAIQPQLYLQLQRDASKGPTDSSFYATFTGPAIYNETLKFHKIEFGDLDKKAYDGQKQANEGWAAMVQHYFVSAWLRTTASPREFYAQHVANSPNYTVGFLSTLAVPAGATVHSDDILYVGPQEEKKLAEMAPGFDLVKDYGWFHILSKPLFWLLDQIYKVIGNWGWAIVLLVVLLKIAFYGLNASAYRSMAKMKKVNPKIMEMRERLKDKPQQMQQEMMRIYKEEKVNPLGSCLPILLQVPFFIALYWVLLSSVEMRHAPWVLWITDLSAKDPWFVLPVLMTLSSLLQVWLQPAPPDPMQAKLMWFMPLAFSFMFFFFPAGLVLYWLVNNLLSIAQQWMINKQLGVQN